MTKLDHYLQVRHRRLLMPDRQTLRPPPARVAPQPPANVPEQHVPPAAIREGLMLEQDAAVARLTERAQREGAVLG